VGEPDAALTGTERAAVKDALAAQRGRHGIITIRVGGLIRTIDASSTPRAPLRVRKRKKRTNEQATR